jgi:RimJ/RimL family protein N-acetyltransferase
MRIFAETMAVHEASRATMAAVGMRYVRMFDQSWDQPVPGSELGEVEYAITRKQWLTDRAGHRDGVVGQESARSDG